jgi:hypothetical protein
MKNKLLEKAIKVVVYSLTKYILLPVCSEKSIDHLRVPESLEPEGLGENIYKV